jgi:hypothetical protein
MNLEGGIRKAVAAILLLAAWSSLARADVLTTTYAANNGYDGNMFDVLVKATMNVTGFDLNLDAWIPPPFGAQYTIKFYVRFGSFVGFDTNPAAWNAIGTVPNVVTAGRDLPTHVDLPGPLLLGPNNTYAFYITTTGDTGTFMRYTNGTSVGAVAASDTHLTIYQGEGLAYPFSPAGAPRIWNGSIYYTVVPEPGPLTLAALGGMLAAVRVTVRGRKARVT